MSSAFRPLLAILVAVAGVLFAVGAASAANSADAQTTESTVDCNYVGNCPPAAPPPPPESSVPTSSTAPTEVENSSSETQAPAATASQSTASQSTAAKAQNVATTVAPKVNAQDLAFTGGDALRIALIGLAAVLVGAGAIVVARRRTAST